jgi:hypothetical protein
LATAQYNISCFPITPVELVLPPLETEKSDTSNQTGTRNSEMIGLRRMGSYIGEGKWKLEEANKK